MKLPPRQTSLPPKGAYIPPRLRQPSAAPARAKLIGTVIGALLVFAALAVLVTWCLLTTLRLLAPHAGWLDALATLVVFVGSIAAIAGAFRGPSK